MAAAARRTLFAASECCSTARKRGQGCRSRAKWQLVESPPRSLHQILAMHSCFDLSNECNAAARKRTIRTPHSNDDLVRAAQPALFTRSQPWVPLREDRTSAIATSRVALPNGRACSCEQRGARQHAVGRTKGEVRRTERLPQSSALPLERLARNRPSEQTTPTWNQHVHTAQLSARRSCRRLLKRASTIDKELHRFKLVRHDRHGEHQARNPRLFRR